MNVFKKFRNNNNAALVILNTAVTWQFSSFTYHNPLKYSSYELFKYKIIILRCTPHISKNSYTLKCTQITNFRPYKTEIVDS